MPDFNFKSYCWSIGTTSFRVKDLNYKIEKQLQLLKSLWNENPERTWRELQVRYYELLKQSGLVTGDAARKDKDAREVTSGLVNIGVIDNERKITPIGEKIISLSEKKDFSPDNIFNISKDSYIYLLQFLKYTVKDETFKTKPFIVLLYLLSELKYLSIDEFTYLLPLCINPDRTKNIIEKVLELRNNSTTIEQILLDSMWSMQNYIDAYDYFNSKSHLTEEDFGLIGMNRKSRNYDKPYKNVFDQIQSIRKEISANGPKSQNLKSLYDNLLQAISNTNLNTRWNAIFRGSPTRARLIDDIDLIEEKIQAIDLFTVPNELFRKRFFEYLHLHKWKATLEDYQDLNKRYLSLTDVLLYERDRITLDFFPKYYFQDISKDIFSEDNFDKLADIFNKNVPLTSISEFLTENIDNVIKKINKIENLSLSENEVYDYLTIQKKRKLQELISTRFTRENIESIIQLIENREDNSVYQLVTDNANIPTIFEYVIALAWFHISDYSVDFLESIRANLDSNLLPRSHAIGGNADIIFKYKETEEYPRHDLLLEATLTEGSNQRRTEMEPVSRHLGEYISESNNEKDYAIFIAPFIHPQVAIDFRNRKNIPYMTSDGQCIKGMKIIPLCSSEVRKYLNNNKKYKEIYLKFSIAFESDDMNYSWYKNEIIEKE